MWRSSVRRVVPIALGRVGDRDLLVEVVADPLLEVGDERVGGGEVADRRLGRERRALVDEQEARDAVGQARARARDEAHRQVDVREGGAGGGDRLEWTTIRDMSSVTRL